MKITLRMIQAALELSAALVTATSLYAAEAFVPDGRLKPGDYTVFMAVDARLSTGLTPFQQGGHGKFYIRGWNRSNQHAEWSVRADAQADYEVSVVIRNNDGKPLRLEVSAAGKTLTATFPAEGLRSWDRVKLDGLLLLPAGNSIMTLRITPADGSFKFDTEVHSLELVRPTVRTELTRHTLAMRADPTWFQQARYGIMVHWTRESVPLHGDPKPYDEAVAAFDVEAFANQVKRTDAGFVVLTTAHAYQFFPAPLASLDRVLPGRTAKRDLVADLAGALKQRGIRLMLYYHLGASSDPEWIKASGAFETDTTKLFTNWQDMISEAGNRYKDDLAGWWFDDGSVGYYYRSPPWESLARAAKAGYPQRLISFNAWELINPTQFHDFCTGEGCLEPRGFCGLLVSGGDGRYPSGTHAGLQASACLITEKNWGHFTRNTPLPPPKWTVEQLTALLNGFITCKNVPIFNLEITQDGKLSPGTIELFEQAAKTLSETTTIGPEKHESCVKLPDGSNAATLRNPIWTSTDNLRDLSVLKVADGYQIFYSRLFGKNWGSPQSWVVANVFTKDFIRYENDRGVSPKGCASPGDVVLWHGRYVLPYQTYPARPTRLVFSQSTDLKSWSAPVPFLTKALELPWNDARRVMDPTFVIDRDALHCLFVGTKLKPSKANLLGE